MHPLAPSRRPVTADHPFNNHANYSNPTTTHLRCISSPVRCTALHSVTVSTLSSVWEF
eukprot:XP_001697375.1 predicted protein [Chlamydomonas reinhardtii]